MGITSIKRDSGNSPSIVRLTTTDSLSTMVATGYLADEADNIEAIQHGVFEWKAGDIIGIDYEDGEGFFTRDADTNSLIAEGGSASNPLTTKGDLFTYSTVNARLPVGTDGQILQSLASEGTGQQWTSTLSNAVQDNITRTGTVASGSWEAGIIGGEFGGTGIDNGPSQISIAGDVGFSGAYNFEATLTAATAVTFPTTGTLMAGSALLSWTPTLQDSSGNNFTLAAAQGHYVITNGVVTFWTTVSWTSKASATAGEAVRYSLPVTTSSTAAGPVANMQWGGIVPPVYGAGSAPNTLFMSPFKRSGTSTLSILVQDCDATGNMVITGTYYAD